MNRFGEFYDRIIKFVIDLPGDDIKSKDENVRLVHEVLDKLYPRVILDVQGWSS